MRRRVTTQAAGTIVASDDEKTRIYYWWLLLVIFFEYVRPGAFFPPIEAAKINTLIPLALLVATIFAPGLRPFKVIFADRYARWLVVYLGLIALSIPFAVVTFYSFDVFKLVLAHFSLFVLIARIATSEQRLRGILAVLMVSHLVILLKNPAVVLNPTVRSYVIGPPFMGDGNDFALSLCILLPMTIELARAARARLVAGIAWGGFVMTILAIMGTQSRGAALGACAVFGFLWLYSRQKAVTLVGISAVVGIVALVGSDTYFNRMKTIKDYDSEGSAQARVMAWKAGVRMALANPVLGVGAGHFPMAVAGKYAPKDGDSRRWMTAHSMYFLVLGELGFPGLITLLALVFGGIHATLGVRKFVLRSAKDPPSDQVLQTSRLLGLLAASGVGLAVAGAFLSVAYYPHIFVLTGIMLSARAIALRGVNVEKVEVVVRKPTSSIGISARDGRRLPSARRALRRR